MQNMTMIESATNRYAMAYKALAEELDDLNNAIEQIKRLRMKAIREAAGKACEKKSELKVIIQSNPDMFVKPRTVVFSGIKVGFQKGKGTISFDDAETVVERIKKLFPDRADGLIAVKETPLKTALAELPANELKRLGCSITDDGDEVVIKPIAGDIEKYVADLLKRAEED